MAQYNHSYPAYHDACTPQTNPGTSTVLVDTGALPAALYEVRVSPGCSVAAIFTLQHRNSSNDGNVSDPILIRAAAGQTGEYIYKFALNANERLRVLPYAAITGDAEAAIQAIRSV